MDKNNYFLVRVSCMTYNHSRYITDAMDGFVMQQTTFPFVCTIVDDASTDGEQEVIRKYVQEHFDLQDSSVAYEKDADYGHVTFAQHKTNKNCYFAIIYLKENHYSQKKSKAPYLTEWLDTKYIALCEGDDYWTDPNRNQKMVDFLESHPKFVLVTHRINTFYEATGELQENIVDDRYYGNKKGISFGRYYNRFIYWQTQTLRTMYRGDILAKVTSLAYPFSLTDGILSYLVLKYGKGYGLNEYMGVYRVHYGGAWSKLSGFEQGYGNLLMYRKFYLYEKSLFAKLAYYAQYIDVYNSFPDELESLESIDNSILFLKIVYVPFQNAKARWFRLKRKVLKIKNKVWMQESSTCRNS